MLKPYREGQEYPTPIKGKDGLLYNLTRDSITWYVGYIKGKSKEYGHLGGYDLDDSCMFEEYRDAWLFFKDCLAGKKPDYETWKPPKK